jgi:glycosyltransferase involved in cell wall biosynthesis
MRIHYYSGPMRVALLTSAQGWRGSAASYAKLAGGLLQRGHMVELVSTAPALTSRFKQIDLPVVEIPGRNTGPREIAALVRVLRRMRPQVIVVDTPRDLRLAVWATFVHHARIVYRYNLNYRRPRTDLADRLYSRRVAAWIFQSQFIQEDALARQPWMARTSGYRIPNGYDTTRFAPCHEAGVAFRRRWDLPDNALVVLTTAKLVRNKGHDVAIEALKRVLRDTSDLVYVVCGNGFREAELRELAIAGGLPARFTGLLEIDQLIAAMSAADLVLHPSVQEIFPNAVGEAMSCARPVVAADAGGTGELMGRDGSTGILVPPGNPEAMAEAVSALVQDPARRDSLGFAARRRIQLEFPLERMITGYEDALRRILAVHG